MPNGSLTHRLSNGLVLVGESMPWLRSAAFTLLIPAGTSQEGQGLQGLGGVSIELCQRGAGPRDSRQIIEALDWMGVERNASVSTFHTSLSAAMVAERLPETLSLYADIVRDPHLPEDEIEESRQTAIQELLAIEDDPSQKIFTELKKLRYGPRHGRSPHGTMEGLNAVKHADVVQFHRDHYCPNGSILSIAGNFDWDTIIDLTEQLFGDWAASKLEPVMDVEVREGQEHIQHDSSQTHIALAYDCVPYQHPDFYQLRGLVSVLSDGMSSRLFTEVREKRGLVYSVSSSSQTLGGHGSVLTYAGTTGGRAQETLDVTLETIRSLNQGIAEDELSRLKSRVKSSLIFEQESSSARSAQMATDWYYLNRIVSRQEVLAEIEALTCESLREHYQAFPPKIWTMVTMGPEALELKHAV